MARCFTLRELSLALKIQGVKTHVTRSDNLKRYGVGGHVTIYVPNDRDETRDQGDWSFSLDDTVNEYSYNQILKRGLSGL